MRVSKKEIYQQNDFGFQGFLFGKPDDQAKAYVRNLIAKEGPAALKELNGNFVGYYLDQQKQEVYVFNDRLGMVDLFLMQCNDQWLITDKYWDAIGECPERTVNELGLSQFLSFGYLHNKHTFIEEISLCAPATLITIDRSSQKIKSVDIYWKHEPNPVIHDEKKALPQLIEAIESGVAESFNEDDFIYASANSGGLDSRWNLHYAAKQEKAFQAYTYAGNLKSDAIHIASKVNKHLGVINPLYIPVETNDFLVRYAAKQISYNPMLPLYSSWYYSAYRQLKGIDVNINGFASTFFDAFTYKDGAEGYEKYLNASVSDKCEFCYQLYNETDESLIKAVYRKKLNNDLKDSFLSDLEALKMNDLGDICDTFDFNCRQRRLNKNEPWNNFYGSVRGRSPLTHNKVVDLSLQLPFHLRDGRYLYKEGAKAVMGKMASIRFERSPIGLNHHSAINKKVRQLLWRADMKMYKKTGWAFTFKGEHKNVAKWMLLSGNLSFMKAAFSQENERFDEYYRRDFILAKLEELVKRDFIFVSSLLTVFLFFKSLDEA